MKGVILAGGNGRRLNPITDVTNKHLLPIYDKPMIFFPIQTLVDAGITDILVVTGNEHAGNFLRLLGSGQRFGCHFSYAIQDDANGIAQALGLAEKFVGNDNCAVILGDNIFADDFSNVVREFDGQKGARIFLKEVPDAERFGVAELDGDRVVHIDEKPKNPKSSYAVTGFYMYDSEVFDVIRNLAPSPRGEFEITDVSNHYIEKGLMKAHFVPGEWTDAGTFESLYRANRVARKIELGRQGVDEKSLLEQE